MAIVRTNPAFAHLAYRRSIVVRLMACIRDDFMALGGDVPKQTIVCDEVLREESVVPEEAFLPVLEELEVEAESLKLQMMKFQFTTGEVHGLLNSAQDEESSEDGGNASKAKGRRKGRRAR